MSANSLMRGQPAFFRRMGFDVVVCSSPGPLLEEVAIREGVRVVAVPMAREISPLKDLAALWGAVRVVFQERPDIVNAGTPKAGLLFMLAGFLARVPFRIYTLRGLRLETEKGARRAILSLAERAASRCAHRVVCVSESLRKRYVSLGLCPAGKALVLGSGSSNGVAIGPAIGAADGSVNPGPAPRGRRDPVIGFVGRVREDKGILELAQAMRHVWEEFPQTSLLVVGPVESEKASACLRELVAEGKPCKLVGQVPDARELYKEIDVVALPSHREGFPNVPLEAAVWGVPTVGFAVVGMVDAVRTGETGTLVEMGDVNGLAQALLTYLRNPALRRARGARAKERALAEFSNESVWKNLARLYDDGGRDAVS